MHFHKRSLKVNPCTDTGTSGWEEEDKCHSMTLYTEKAEQVCDTEDVSDPISGWTECFDETYQRFYFINNETGESQWEAPDFGEYGIATEDQTGEDTASQPNSTKKVLGSQSSQGVEHLDFHDIDTKKKDDSTSEEARRHQHCGDDTDCLEQSSKTVQVPEGTTEQSIPRRTSYQEIRAQFFDDDYYNDDDADVQDAHGLYDEKNELDGIISDQDGPDREDSDEQSYNILSQQSASKDMRSLLYQPRDDFDKVPDYGEGNTNAKNLHGSPLIGGRNRDYIGMAQLYKMQRQYSNPEQQVMCLLCRSNYATDVFFPCQHRCVCRECIEKELICSDSLLAEVPGGYCNCSLCAEIIKLILPSEGGREVEKYWQWVYEEPMPPLPRRFLRDFRHSAAVIRAAFSSSGGDPDSFENSAKKCLIS